MNNQRLKIGIVGAGRIGRVHAESLALRLPEACIMGIADVSRDVAEEVAARWAIPRVTDSSAEIISDPEIEAVLICSSTDTHACLIMEAAKAGKHIFCEKPISFCLDEIDRALEVVREAGVKLQIGFNRRFDANFARVRQAIVAGEVGAPRMLHIISRDPGPPPLEYLRISGGIFNDMTIHDFDMARFLIGDEVEEIYTAGAVMVDPEIGKIGDLDTALIVLRFRSGVIGTIDNSRNAAYGYDQRVEILGSRGKICTENCYPNQAVISNGACVYTDLPLNFFMDRYRDSFTIELRSFVSAIREGKPTAVSGNDGRIPVVMALAARKSFDERRPVKLEEIGV